MGAGLGGWVRGASRCGRCHGFARAPSWRACRWPLISPSEAAARTRWNRRICRFVDDVIAASPYCADLANHVRRDESGIRPGPSDRRTTEAERSNALRITSSQSSRRSRVDVVVLHDVRHVLQSCPGARSRASPTPGPRRRSGCARPGRSRWKSRRPWQTAPCAARGCLRREWPFRAATATGGRRGRTGAPATDRSGRDHCRAPTKVPCRPNREECGRTGCPRPGRSPTALQMLSR